MNPPAQTEGVVNGSVRLWLRAEGLAMLVMSGLLYGHLGARWWIFAALLLVPDLCMLGYLINAKVGAVAYNVVHSYLLPLVLAAVALVTHHPGAAPFLCIWTAHIGMDRLLGYGLKYPTAFTKTHLGMLGKISG